ncbi:unnamed protein product [Parnassius apollo]|uniref:(apollo) hypothetical protein n=1 Tax=Parnassius apollo TaxID=110799 RepID=A0A8S3W2I4_PARAO|nr:unnamed protein product [Parnassius apollo]
MDYSSDDSMDDPDFCPSTEDDDVQVNQIVEMKLGIHQLHQEECQHFQRISYLHCQIYRDEELHDQEQCHQMI